MTARPAHYNNNHCKDTQPKQLPIKAAKITLVKIICSQRQQVFRGIRFHRFTQNSGTMQRSMRSHFDSEKWLAVQGVPALPCIVCCIVHSSSTDGRWYLKTLALQMNSELMLLPETCDPSTLPSFDNAMTVSGTFTNNDQVVLACASNFGPMQLSHADATRLLEATTCLPALLMVRKLPWTTCSPSKKQTFKTFYCTLCITLKRVTSFRCPS